MLLQGKRRRGHIYVQGCRSSSSPITNPPRVIALLKEGRDSLHEWVSCFVSYFKIFHSYCSCCPCPSSPLFSLPSPECPVNYIRFINFFFFCLWIPGFSSRSWNLAVQEAASPLPPSQPDHKTDIKLKLAGVEGKDRKAVWNGWTKGESQGRGGGRWRRRRRNRDCCTFL